MLIEYVKRLSPTDRLLYWITEREAIRLRRESGEPWPWTDDEILRSYRFCDVRRMDDRVSRWLLENWYDPYRDHQNVVLACVLARQLNNTDSLGEVGFPEVWEPERVQTVLGERTARGLGNYSAAYMITASYGARGRPKESKPYQTVWRVCQPVYESGVRPDTDYMSETWSRLVGMPGLSSFMAGQVTADLRWAATGTWADRWTWAPLGPGSSRGLNRLLDRPVDSGWCQISFLGEALRLFNRLRPSLPPGAEMMDLQNCLCEWDKYERALWNQGRPKQRYRHKCSS